MQPDCDLLPIKKDICVTAFYSRHIFVSKKHLSFEKIPKLNDPLIIVTVI